MTDSEDKKKLAKIEADEDDSPYVYVNGKKELKNGGGMIKESILTVQGAGQCF